MKTLTGLSLLLVASVLVAGGYFYHQAELAATARAEYFAEPISEDSAVTVAFSASGLLNRTVRVAAFDFGSEDRTIEDEYTDQILHDKLGKIFYEQGFRRVVLPGSNVSRNIVMAQSGEFPPGFWIRFSRGLSLTRRTGAPIAESTAISSGQIASIETG